MIWFREMHEQHTVRFDGRGGRVEEGPRTERAGWKKARSWCSESGCSVFRLSGCELLAAAGASRNRARASANECGAEKVGCEEQ